MYFRQIESDPKAAQLAREFQMGNAARRLKENQQKAHLTQRPAANRNRKQAAKLDSRRNDYTQMIAKPRSDNWSGYHKPGSNQ